EGAMNRILACLIGVSVAALPVVANARGNGSGGGHCETGSRGNTSNSHKSNHSAKGSGAYHVPYFSTFWLFGYSGYYRAGYVLPDGTYVEPSQETAPAEPQPEFRNDCPPDTDC